MWLTICGCVSLRAVILYRLQLIKKCAFELMAIVASAICIIRSSRKHRMQNAIFHWWKPFERPSWIPQWTLANEFLNGQTIVVSNYKWCLWNALDLCQSDFDNEIEWWSRLFFSTRNFRENLSWWVIRWRELCWPPARSFCLSVDQTH